MPARIRCRPAAALPHRAVIERRRKPPPIHPQIPAPLPHYSFPSSPTLLPLPLSSPVPTHSTLTAPPHTPSRLLPKSHTPHDDPLDQQHPLFGTHYPHSPHHFTASAIPQFDDLPAFEDLLRRKTHPTLLNVTCLVPYFPRTHHTQSPVLPPLSPLPFLPASSCPPHITSSASLIGVS